MALLWILSGAALVVAVLAWRAARDSARRLDQLSQMYWALRYQHGELRGQLLQGAPAPPAADAPPGPAPGQSEGRPPDVFVPLSSLRR